MIRISEKTLKDLEFYTILDHIADLCNTEYGKIKAQQIVPLATKKDVHTSLQQVFEYKSSYFQDSRIPNHGFDSIDKELQLLGIENTFLETLHLKKITSISLTANNLLSFFRKFKELYPVLFLHSSDTST